MDPLDFYPTFSSPLRDAGTPTYNMMKYGMYDYYSQPRVANSRIDIGPLEYVIPLGIQNMLQQGDRPELFPNPCSSVLSIKDPSGDAYWVEVIDKAGRFVMQLQILTKNSNAIDVTGLPKGVYCLRLTGLTGRCYSLPFLKG